MSGANAYVEQYVAYHFATAPRMPAGTTLTSVGMVKY
jgi:hypothetical protein